jgi:hypothetical protein
MREAQAIARVSHPNGMLQRHHCPCDLCRIARGPNPGFDAGHLLRRERGSTSSSSNASIRRRGLQRSCHLPQPVAR